MIARGLAVAALAAVAYALLGEAVAHRPPETLWPIDAGARVIAGHAAHVALIFTASCWWPAMTAYGVAAIGLAVARPAWRGRVAFSIGVTVAGWVSSDALKEYFRRPRPAYWTLHHETTYAYASGHAMFAVLVFGLWAFYVASSDLPRRARTAIASALSLWACGIIWSRLALGAHWPTDLAGGILLAAALLGLAAALSALPRIVMPRPPTTRPGARGHPGAALAVR